MDARQWISITNTILLANGSGPKRKDDVVEFGLAETYLAFLHEDNQGQQMVLVVKGLDDDTPVERENSLLKASHFSCLKAIKTIFEALGISAFQREQYGISHYLSGASKGA